MSMVPPPHYTTDTDTHIEELKIKNNVYKG